MLRGRTSFVIAHRLSTIRHADLIVVLINGEIVERGTHDDLMRTSSRYRSMVELQTGPAIQLPNNGNGHPGVSHQSLGHL